MLFVCLISGFRRDVNQISLFWDLTQRLLVITDVSRQPFGPIFKERLALKRLDR